MVRIMRRNKRFMGALAVGLVLSLAAVACGGRDDDTSSSGGGSGTTSASGGGAFTIDTDNCGTYNATQGVTDDSIKLGSSFAQSGLYSAYAEISKGYLAYFDYINATQNGVNGRKIEVITKDDQYDPNKTRQNVQELTQSDQVFGLFNVVGTPNNLAIRDDLATACIPNLFVASGSVLWGETEDYPWLIGSIPSYATESAIFADYLKANKPQAKVAILGQNDDVGSGYADAFRGAIEGTDISVVAEEKYSPTDPDVKSQITTLAASGADTILLAAAALKCAQALNAIQEQNWDVTTYMSGTCTSKTVIGLANPGAADGVISSIYLKDPADPEWDSDPAMQEFQTLGAQYGLGPDELENGIVGYGWTMGALLVETLKQSGEITRQSVMQTAYSLSNLQVGLLLPGATVNTNGAEDPFPIEQMQIGIYNGQFWDLQGDLVSFEGKTAEFVG
jgi:branched-chain amino acid transport system substrate-binding protein